MRVERFPAQAIYDNAAGEIAVHLDSGADVVVLCEGDPFFYGSFMYLFERLSGAFECEIVPGISSLMASAAAMKRPLAARNDVLTVLPGPLPDEQILAQLKASDAIAIIKVGRHFKRLCDLIERAGLTANAGYPTGNAGKSADQAPWRSAGSKSTLFFHHPDLQGCRGLDFKIRISGRAAG